MKGDGPGLPERPMLSMAPCFPKTHRVPGACGPRMCGWRACGLWWVSPGSGQEAGEGVTPLPCSPSAFALLHLSLPPCPRMDPAFRPQVQLGAPHGVPARVGVQPAVPGSHRAGSEARRAVSISKSGIP